MQFLRQSSMNYQQQPTTIATTRLLSHAASRCCRFNGDDNGSSKSKSWPGTGRSTCGSAAGHPSVVRPRPSQPVGLRLLLLARDGRGFFVGLVRVRRVLGAGTSVAQPVRVSVAPSIPPRSLGLWQRGETGRRRRRQVHDDDVDPRRLTCSPMTFRVPDKIFCLAE